VEEVFDENNKKIQNTSAETHTVFTPFAVAGTRLHGVADK
jgi:hypothetical protein